MSTDVAVPFFYGLKKLSTVFEKVKRCQAEILKNILHLCRLRRFTLDPTYGRGCFYKEAEIKRIGDY